MHVQQFRRFVVRPTLGHLDLASEAAENLVVGTAVHESGRLTYIDQVTGPGDDTLGPAYGLYQIEPATHADLYASWLAYRPELREALLQLAAAWPHRVDQLVTNLAYATAVCRLIYRRVPEPLPAADDVDGLAAYWKRHYNTAAGKGLPSRWAHDYRMAHRDAA